MTVDRASSLPSPLRAYGSESNRNFGSNQDLPLFQNVNMKAQQLLHLRPSTHGTSALKDTSQRRKAEEERLKRVADVWDQIRAEVHQERYDSLNTKVALQRALIAAQDRHSELLRRQEEETRRKKYNEEKKQKQETLAALQDKCRQSLAIDRKSKHKTVKTVTDVVSADVKKLAEGKRDVSENSPSVLGSMASGHTGHTGHMPLDTMNELDNENETVEKSGYTKEKSAKGMMSSASAGSLPKHQLLGRKVSQSLSSKLQLQKRPANLNEKGHVSASEIWTVLRSDSLSKLWKADQSVPRDLKETFGSHVRQSITKFQKPVSRSFTQDEDVPDLKHLMDQSMLHRTRLLRHKTQLMYRSSQINQDRTHILLYNNPLPLFCEDGGGISRFLPPAEISDSVHSEIAYERQLENSSTHETDRGDSGERGSEKSASPQIMGRKHSVQIQSPAFSDVSQGLQDIWQAVVACQKPIKMPKYHFLTEKEAQVKGDFLSRLFLDKREKVKDPHNQLFQGHTLKSSPGIKSAGDMRSLRQSLQGMQQGITDSAIFSSSSPVSRYESPWEPLSMNALVEYKKQLSAEGSGEFQQGRTRIWNLTGRG